MNVRNLAAAIVAAMMVIGMPALNLAQTPTPEPQFEEREQREQERMIRRAEEQAERAALQVERAALQAERAAKQAVRAADWKINQKINQNLNRHGDQKGSAPLEHQIRQAAAQVRDAEDEAAKTAATQELVSLLDQYFEQDIEVRNKELQEIESRLQKLQQQLDRRRAKKQEIIDLQVKVALNEAEGLGFYGERKDSMFNIRVSTPVFMTTSDDPFAAPAPAVPPAPPAPAVPSAQPDPFAQ